MRRALGRARPVHALLADAHGVWAWDPRDCHAGATRHASVSTWLKRHPGCDLRLWVGAELAHSLVSGSGPDRGSASDGNRNRNRADDHDSAPTATVCVVEARQLAWISAVQGQLAQVQQTVLADASVGSLQAALAQRPHASARRARV